MGAWFTPKGKPCVVLDDVEVFSWSGVAMLLGTVCDACVVE